MVQANLKVFCAGLGLVCGAGSLIALYGCGSGNSTSSVTPPPPVQGKIKHVVVIFQENRTPDNLFHGLPGADIANSVLDSSGNMVTLDPVSLVTDYDLRHAHADFVAMYDGGKMDGADKVIVRCAQGRSHCPPPNPHFRYVNPQEVQPYFQMAEQYTFGDRMFQTNQGPSFPAHQFLISGTSAPSPGSNLFAAENPDLPKDSNVGCAGPPEETVAMIDPTGDESTRQFPCFEHATLPDLLDSHGISWRYYTPGAGTIWVGPNAIQHLRFGPDWQKVIIPQTAVLTDIANGQLAQVTWVIPTGQASDHAGVNDGTGPSWVASVVNAIGNSQYWSDTAIFIAWDDWGGWPDHVAPQILNAYEYGFRVPLIVISPYARRGYVSHVTHDFGSLLKFTEATFNLPSLGYADSVADNLFDCFDFNQAPTPFQPFAVKFDANYFLNDHRAALDPDDD